MSKKKDDSRDPIESSWRGVPTWRCPFCDRDSEDKATLEAHIDADHPLAAPHPLAPAAHEETPDATTATDQDRVHGTVSGSGGGADGDR